MGYFSTSAITNGYDSVVGCVPRLVTSRLYYVDVTSDGGNTWQPQENRWNVFCVERGFANRETILFQMRFLDFCSKVIHDKDDGI